MKKLIIALAILVIPMSLLSQHEDIEMFYNKHVGNEKITNISLNGWILSLASKMSDENGTEILEKITKLRVLVAEDNVIPTSDIKQLMKDVRSNQYEDLVVVREEDTRVNIMLREEGKTITNVLIVVRSDDEFILLSLEGNLNFDDLKELDFDIEGGDFFKKIPQDRA